MKKKLLAGIIIIAILVLAYGIYYVNDYYHAEDSAKELLNGTDNVSITDTSNGLFLDSPGNDTALIFYPGAKVEYTSYLPLLMQLSNKENIDCFLVKMPFNLAFLGVDSADNIMDNTSYKHYFLAGHSLGGVMASKYINTTNRTDGLILFESYVSDGVDKPVLSIYGSEDKILNMDTYQESKPLMSKNLTEVVIPGGNHAQIGNYGNQSGDGIAKISSQEQQSQSVDAMTRFIDGLV